MNEGVEQVWDLVLLPVIRLLVEGVIQQGVATGACLRSRADMATFDQWLVEWRERPGVDIVRPQR